MDPEVKFTICLFGGLAAFFAFGLPWVFVFGSHASSLFVAFMNQVIEPYWEWVLKFGGI